MSKTSTPKIPNVGAQDPTKKNSPIAPKGAKEEPAKDRNPVCWFNGTQYSHGSAVCSGGRLLRCSGTTWYDSGSC